MDLAPPPLTHLAHTMCLTHTLDSSASKVAVTHLNVVAYTVRAAHLEEDTVVDDGQIGVEELGAHDRIAARTRRWLENSITTCMQTKQYKTTYS